MASQEVNNDTVVMLLDSGADTEMRDSSRQTVVWIATVCGWTDVVDTVNTHGADTDAAEYRVQSPICEADERGYLNVMKRLIEQKANIIGEEVKIRFAMSPHQ